jgi:hypothetical protein
MSDDGYRFFAASYGGQAAPLILRLPPLSGAGVEAVAVTQMAHQQGDNIC